MNKGFLALFSVFIIGISVLGVSAYRDNEALNSADNAEWQSLERCEKLHNNRKSIHEALEQNDYEAWIEAVSALPHAPENFRETVTEADFEVLVQIHRLREEENYEAAKSLKEELDFELPHRCKTHRISPPCCECMNSE